MLRTFILLEILNLFCNNFRHVDISYTNNILINNESAFSTIPFHPNDRVGFFECLFLHALINGLKFLTIRVILLCDSV